MSTTLTLTLTLTLALARGEERSLTASLAIDPRVEWAEQQIDKVRVKRGWLGRQEERLERLLRRREEKPEEGLKSLLKAGEEELVGKGLEGLEEEVLVRTGESLDGKAIPEELVALWREEEALEGRPGPGPGPRPHHQDRTFNDELWDHQVACLGSS